MGQTLTFGPKDSGAGTKRKMTAIMTNMPNFILDGQGPLFRQIGRAVTEQIMKGRYKQGERLPSEAELTTIFNTSRQTVNKELRTLEQMGVIKAAYGRVTIHDLEALRQAAGG